MTDFFRPQRGTSENAGTIAIALWLALTAMLILAYFVSTLFDALLGDEPWQSLTVSFSTTIPLLAMTLCAPLLYRRRVLSLITSAHRFRWNLLLLGVAVWGSLLVIGTLVGVLLSSGELAWNFNASEFVPMALVCALLIPIQISSEELFYRGLIPQALGRAIKSDSVVITFTTLLFALPHLLNPEAQEAPGLALIAYAAISLGWAVAAQKWGGLEITLGAHLINNVFGILIVGYTNAVVATSPLWLGPAPDMAVTAVSSVVTCAAWFAILHFIAQKKPSLLQR